MSLFCRVELSSGDRILPKAVLQCIGVGVSAELYEEQNYIGVIAVAKACCQALLQSNTEQWKLYFSKGNAAVYWCWVSAELYEEQNFIGVIAVAKACYQALLQSSIEQ